MPELAEWTSSLSSTTSHPRLTGKKRFTLPRTAAYLEDTLDAVAGAEQTSTQYSPALIWPEFSGSGMEWLALIGPLEGLGHGAIEVGDEGEHLVLQIIHGAEVAAP